MAAIVFTVPLVPPSVNHYKLRTRKGVTFVTAEAKAFKDAVLFFRPRVNDPLNVDCEVEAIIYRGKGGKGDVDNYAKLILDSLVYSGLLVSDDLVTDLTLRKRRDAENPRTEITIRTI